MTPDDVVTRRGRATHPFVRCAEHRTFFDATGGGRDVRAALAASVAQVDRLLVLQRGWVEDIRAATEQRRRARRTIRDAMTAIAAIGRTMRLADSATMRRPEPMADGDLLACARTLVGRVSPQADAFEAAGLPAATLGRLESAIPHIEAAIQAQAGYRQRFSAASDTIREALNDADTVTTVLDVIARHTPDAPPEILVRLRIAKRVGHRGGRHIDHTPVARRVPAEPRALIDVDDRRDVDDCREPTPTAPTAATVSVDHADAAREVLPSARMPRVARVARRLLGVWSRARGLPAHPREGAVILPLRRYG